MRPRFGTLSLGGDMGGTSIFDPDLEGDLGGDMGPTFRTPILTNFRLMPNVISKIKQNSSDTVASFFGE
jgi:hypothetical protein